MDLNSSFSTNYLCDIGQMISSLWYAHRGMRIVTVLSHVDAMRIK